jgi:hypothetical protein
LEDASRTSDWNSSLQGLSVASSVSYAISISQYSSTWSLTNKMRRVSRLAAKQQPHPGSSPWNHCDIAFWKAVWWYKGIWKVLNLRISSLVTNYTFLGK